MENDKTSLRKPISNIWLGLFLIAAGILTAAWRLHYNIPNWLVSWPAALIAGGLLLGIYTRFRTILWVIPVFWGVYLLVLVQEPELNLREYAAPASIILAGIIVLGIRSSAPKMMNGRFRFGFQKNDSFISANSFLCNAKKEVVSQDFKGADASCILGNTVIDLRNADIHGKAHIDITVFFGNAKIYIPESWVMRNDITTVFGDIRHKTAHINAVVKDDKVIVLDGTAVFGNIAIVSC